MTLATSSRSVNGTQAFANALSGAGGATALDGLTKDGFTVFVPVDDAFTADVQATLGKGGATAQTILGNHVSRDVSLSN